MYLYCWISRTHCQESGEESSESETVYSLKCHISHDVNHLHEGLRHVSGLPPPFWSMRRNCSCRSLDATLSTILFIYCKFTVYMEYSFAIVVNWLLVDTSNYCMALTPRLAQSVSRHVPGRGSLFPPFMLLSTVGSIRE